MEKLQRDISRIIEISCLSVIPLTVFFDCSDKRDFSLDRVDCRPLANISNLSVDCSNLLDCAFVC